MSASSPAAPDPQAQLSTADQQTVDTLKLAYRWGYPLLAMAINNSDFYGPTTNAFYHMKSAADEKSQNGKGFNAEVLYSAGALDLTKEPLVFSMPAVGDRFVVFPVQDGWGNIDNVIGTRTVGNHPVVATAKNGIYLVKTVKLADLRTELPPTTKWVTAEERAEQRATRAKQFMLRCLGTPAEVGGELDKPY